MKTRREWFNMIPDAEIRYRLFINCIAYEVKENSDRLTGIIEQRRSISSAFAWNRTSEGNKFWSEISTAYRSTEIHDWHGIKFEDFVKYLPVTSSLDTLTRHHEFDSSVTFGEPVKDIKEIRDEINKHPEAKNKIKAFLTDFLNNFKDE